MVVSLKNEEGEDSKKNKLEEDEVVCGCGPDWQSGLFFAREELEGASARGQLVSLPLLTNKMLGPFPASHHTTSSFFCFHTPDSLLHSYYSRNESRLLASGRVILHFSPLMVIHPVSL